MSLALSHLADIKYHRKQAQSSCFLRPLRSDPPPQSPMLPEVSSQHRPWGALGRTEVGRGPGLSPLWALACTAARPFHRGLKKDM